MKIVVVGGTGLIGSKVVEKLRDQQHEAVAASPESGVNTLTGAGLADVLDAASVVVDVSNSPSFADDAVLEFFRTSTSNLLRAERDAGVAHHVALSVVGTQRLAESGYFRAKIAQEELIAASAIPFTIVHATQFFEFIDKIALAATEGDVVRVAPVMIQPMAADDVAGAVAEAAVGDPVGGIIEVAGPEPFRLDELIRQTLEARHDPRRVVSEHDAPYFGAHLTEQMLLPAADAQLGRHHYAAWLAQSLVGR